MKTAVEWNIENPKKIDNYIVDLGANGVSLAWYNGKEWIKMWSSNILQINGWIEIPKFKKNNMKTAVEFLEQQIGSKIADANIRISAPKFYELINQAKEMEVNLAEAFATFAEFAILTDRRTLNTIKFRDWCKKYNEKTI